MRLEEALATHALRAKTGMVVPNPGTGVYVNLKRVIPLNSSH